MTSLITLELYGREESHRKSPLVLSTLFRLFILRCVAFAELAWVASVSDSVTYCAKVVSRNMDVGGGWGEKRKTFLFFSSPFIPLFRSRYKVRNEVSKNLIRRLLLSLLINVTTQRTLKPVGHQSTNWMVLLVLIVAIAAFTSLGTTSPRYSRQQAMYLPWRGSHFTIWLAGSKQALVISATLNCSW